MKLSASQFRWLQWLHDHGGAGYVDGPSLRAGNDQAGAASAMTFLHLIAKGTVEFNSTAGAFMITPLGKRTLVP